MTELQIFENSEFGTIRTVEVEGKPYFVGKDIAVALGYKDSTNTLKQYCRWVVKRHLPHPQSHEKEIEVSVIIRLCGDNKTIFQVTHVANLRNHTEYP